MLVVKWRGVLVAEKEGCMYLWHVFVAERGRRVCHQEVMASIQGPPGMDRMHPRTTRNFQHPGTTRFILILGRGTKRRIIWGEDRVAGIGRCGGLCAGGWRSGGLSWCMLSDWIARGTPATHHWKLCQRPVPSLCRWTLTLTCLPTAPAGSFTLHLAAFSDRCSKHEGAGCMPPMPP